MDWMLYGAYGYTGKIITRLAAEAGMEPLLAGRSREKLQPLADKYDFNYDVISLDETRSLRETVAQQDAVLHAAGPFTKTSPPMVEACLKGSAHYLDITGEIPVFESIFDRNREASESGIALIPGMGFDVVPSDCLAHYVATRVEEPDYLRIVVNADMTPSKGTLITALDQLTQGGWCRRDGELVSEPLANRTAETEFPDGSLQAISAPLGDLVSAWHSTGVPDIDTFVSLPVPFTGAMGSFARIFSTMLKVPYVKGTVRLAVEGMSALTSDDADDVNRENWFYARAENERGESSEAWLKTPETYFFTALSALEGIKRLETAEPSGAVSPSMAFGDDFVLAIQGVERFDRLEKGGSREVH